MADIHAAAMMKLVSPVWPVRQLQTINDLHCKLITVKVGMNYREDFKQATIASLNKITVFSSPPYSFVYQYCSYTCSHDACSFQYTYSWLIGTSKALCM